jgi:Patatin-like phospholipase
MYDRLKSGSGAPWFVALFVAFALFLLRRRLLGGAATPDSFWLGYTPAQVADFLKQIGPAGRSLYAWTQLTLDVVFPVIYVVCIGRPLARTASPAIGPLLIWLPFVVAGFDLVENVLTAYLAWTFDGRPSPLAEFASLFTRSKYAFLVVSLGALLLVWLHKARERLVYFYLARFPLLLALALVLLPVLSGTVFRNALGNLYVLGPGEMFAVSLAAVLAAAAILVNARLVLLYGRLRFGVAPFGSPTKMPLWQPLVALAAAWWLIGFAIVQSFMGASRSDLWLLLRLVGGALLGTAAAFAIVWIGEALRFLTADPASLTDFREGVETPDLVVPRQFIPAKIREHAAPGVAKTLSASVSLRVGPEGAPGYVSQGALLSGHVFASLILLAWLGVYGLTFYLDHPTAKRGAIVPALAYLLALLTLPTWMFSGAAFFLDRYRVPALVVPALLLVLAFVSPTDHFFDTQALPTGSTELAASGGGAPARGAEPSDLIAVLNGCRLTAVATSGGGIRAAGWTAEVLTRLHQEVPDFSRSLRIVSSVSGGSVGTMYFVGAFAGPDGPPPQALEDIRQLAVRSSLNSVAWGFSYPDLWRTFGPFVPESATDRARTLELAWARDWPPRAQTLAQWRDDAANGRRPAVAFNATVVETGRRLVFGSFDMKPVARTRRMRTDTFDRIYPGRDISIVTAARLSATFTYVTPVARARPEDPTRWHVADGGYQDNYGVGTLADWLDTALSGAAPVDENGAACAGRLRVAVVLIGSLEADSPGRNRSWAFQMGAPMVTLLNIRSAGPKARNDMELELLAGVRGPLGAICFTYANDDSPLSWHLSEAQKQKIRDAWKDQAEPRQLLDDFLHGRRDAPPTCPR